MNPQKHLLQLLPKPVRRVVSNKYLLASAAFFIWFIGCDRYGLTTQCKLHQTAKQLERDKAFYEQEIKRVWEEKHDLEQNTEKFAREKFYMSKENEEVFVFPEKEE